MEHNPSAQGPILRLFQVRTKPGCAGRLIEKFATTSADVVQHEPGNVGYFFGGGVEHDADVVVFSSLWRDMDAVKQRFGADWQVSFLPEGYEDMIEECSVTHIDLRGGWHVRMDG